MKVYQELYLSDFEAWGTAQDTLNTLWDRYGAEDINNLGEYICNHIYDGFCTEDDVNDYLAGQDDVAEYFGFENWDALWYDFYGDEEDDEDEDDWLAGIADTDGSLHSSTDFENFCHKFEDCKSCPLFIAHTINQTPCEELWEEENMVAF